MAHNFNVRKALEVLSDDSSEGSTREKIKTLYQLSTLSNVNIIPREVIEKIIEILETTENRMIINSILAAIQHLAQFERTRMMLGDSTDCIKLLVPYMSQFNFPNIQSNALDALCQLVKGYTKNQETLMKYANEFFNPILGIIQREADNIVKKATNLLDTLFDNTYCVHTIFGDENNYDEYLEPLIICLQMEQNKPVVEWALSTIEKACSKNIIYIKYLMDIGIIDPLCNILLDKSNLHQSRVLALKILVFCCKFSNEGGKWTGEGADGLTIESLIDIMYQSSMELNSSNITQSYALSSETNELRELSFELMMYMTHFLIGREHLRNLTQVEIENNLAKRAEEDTLGLETNNKGNDEDDGKKLKEEKKIEIPSLFDNKKKAGDDEEEETKIVDILQENKRKIVMHVNGLQVLFAYIGQDDPPKDQIVERKHVGRVRKYAIQIIANLCTISEYCVIILNREQRLISHSDKAMNIIDLLLDILVNKKEKISERDKKKLAAAKNSLNATLDIKLDLKQVIINAMESFSLHNDSVNKLTEIGVIKRLLKMIDDGIEPLEVAKLLAKMCEHTNFQQVFFEEQGLQRIIKLLHGTDPDHRYAGLLLCLPLASTPKGCIALSRENIDKLVKSIVKKEVLFENVRSLARKVNHIFKLNNNSSLRATKAATGLNLNNEELLSLGELLKFNYEEIARIDKDYVVNCQMKIRELLKNNKFRIQVNWREIERLIDCNFADQAISILSRQELWDELVLAIEEFVEASDANFHSFNTQVHMIILEVLPPKKKENKEVSKGEEDEGEEDEEAMPCELEVNELFMKYKISPDGVFWTPKQLAGLISFELLLYDIIEFNSTLLGGEAEDRDEQYELGIDQLKRVCKDSRLAMLGDINILYFHLESNELLWRSSFAESQMITASKSIIAADELFIKGWKIAKLNKDGLLQERILLLTNKSYYTVCFDPKSKKIDFKHCKHHNLADYFLCDVGKLVKSKYDTTGSTIHLYEDGKNKYALNLVTNEKPHKSKKNNKLEEEAEELHKLKHMSFASSTSSSFGATPSDDLSMSTSLDRLDSDDLLSTAQDEDSSLPKELPSTIGKYASPFLPPDSVPRNKQKCYLLEIAWCFRAVASAFQRQECNEIYERDIIKPIESKLARLYNMTGLGKKKDSSIISKHMEAKQRREQEKQEQRIKQAQTKGLKNIKNNNL
ncbi:hypothetical protein ABK040_010664 [Willaertia magna]